MKRFAGCFILVAIAFHSGLGQSDDATDCSKMNFATLPKDCCKTPFGDVFIEQKMGGIISECKPSSKLMAWANSYKINTLQEKDLKNFINETSKTTVKELCSAGAFMECVFIKNEWLNSSGSIDVGALSSYMEGVAPTTVWKDIADKMLTPMHPSYSTSYPFTDILEDRFESMTCPSGKVNLLPLMMAQMIQSEFIWMCPQQNVYTSKNKCVETMKNYQFCDGKIYSPLAKGVFYFPSV